MSIKQYLSTCSVVLYDLLLRTFLSPSYYIIFNKQISTSEYFETKVTKSARTYVASAYLIDKTDINFYYKNTLNRDEINFAYIIFKHKHNNSYIIFLLWRILINCISNNYKTVFTIVKNNNKIIAIFVDYTQPNIHYFISALIDDTESKKYGIYVSKYYELINHCITNNIKILRLGPTTDELKIKLGAIVFPLFVIDSPVYATIGNIAIVNFGIFTSIALFIYIFLTQYQIHNMSIGALSILDLTELYIWCIVCAKIIPLFSLGSKFFKKPYKYIRQTTFYAHGVLFGVSIFIIHKLYIYKDIYKLLTLLDGLSMFTFLADFIGRLGCHYYGCCFGKPLTKFSPFGVIYIHKHSSVCRLHNEYQYIPLIPSQIYQAFCSLLIFVSLHIYSYYHTLYIGFWCYSFLFLYNLSRCIFYQIRADEDYKNKKSHTTLYLAIIMLFTTAISYMMLEKRNYDVFHILYPTPSIMHLFNYCSIALLLSFMNLLIQGCHNRNRIGYFPNLLQFINTNK